MSIDKLQEKIRKRKNPSVVDLTVDPSVIPPALMLSEGSLAKAYERWAWDMLAALDGLVPAVRFRFSAFAVLGAEGMDLLAWALKRARDHNYYVLLDAPEATSEAAAQWHARCLLDDGAALSFDGLIVTSYIGSDGLKPYVKLLRQKQSSLFAVLRTPNKSASEIQDLLTGSRLVHMAMADVVSHLGESLPGKCGYSQVGGVGAATSADSVRKLRSKYPGMFLLIDGYDCPGANAKNCSNGFDTLGHGAAVCAGSSIAAAWREIDPQNGTDYIYHAVQAAERMKKNLTRYVTVL